MKTITAFIVIALLGSTSLTVRSDVLRCTEHMSAIEDNWLAQSILELKQTHPAINFQNDDEPCLNAKATENALLRTVKKNYLKRVTSYEYVKIIRGDTYFTVERFRSRDTHALQKLVAALTNNRTHKLKIEANTYYEFFLSGDNFVIMISSATGRKENSEMFLEVRQTFESLQKSTLKPTPPAAEKSQ